MLLNVMIWIYVPLVLILIVVQINYAMDLKFVKDHFCGDTLDDASQCNDNDACLSISGSDFNSDSDCSLGQSYYGFEVC